MSTKFAHLGLPDSLVDALSKRSIVESFPVQEATIPDALAGRDVSGKAPTGSGKTLAFGLPLLARVEIAKSQRPRALILAPTRELAEQIKEELAPLARAVDRYVSAVYGGVSYGPQKSALRKGVDVLVATSLSSTKPTAWRTWDSCRRSGGSSTTLLGNVRHFSFRRRSTVTSPCSAVTTSMIPCATRQGLWSRRPSMRDTTSGSCSTTIAFSTLPIW